MQSVLHCFFTFYRFLNGKLKTGGKDSLDDILSHKITTKAHHNINAWLNVLRLLEVC